MVLRAAPILLDVAEENAHGFGPLKAILGAISAIYVNYEVRLRPPVQNSPLTNLFTLQETIPVRNKIEDLLSRVATLEELFATLPGDVAEQRCRSEVIRYAIIPLLDTVLSSFQQARGHRGTIAVTVRKSRGAATF